MINHRDSLAYKYRHQEINARTEHYRHSQSILAGDAKEASRFRRYLGRIGELSIVIRQRIQSESVGRKPSTKSSS